VTVALPPTAPGAENDKRFLDALDSPAGLFELDETRTKLRPKGAPYAITMLVAPAAGLRNHC
jgi:hypothetical protein